MLPLTWLRSADASSYSEGYSEVVVTSGRGQPQASPPGTKHVSTTRMRLRPSILRYSAMGWPNDLGSRPKSTRIMSCSSPACSSSQACRISTNFVRIDSPEAQVSFSTKCIDRKKRPLRASPRGRRAERPQMTTAERAASVSAATARHTNLEQLNSKLSRRNGKTQSTRNAIIPSIQPTIPAKRYASIYPPTWDSSLTRGVQKEVDRRTCAVLHA